MDNYDRMLEGRITAINNFVFEDGKLDHAWKNGRLCLIIYADDEYEYVLPITHYVSEKLKSKYYYISDDSFKEKYKRRLKETTLTYKNKLDSKNKNEVSGYINLRNIYKVPIAYRNEIGKLKYKVYKNIIKKLNYLHKTESLEEVINERVIK